jgi:2-dehydro-3-deoxygluconokinase
MTKVVTLGEIMLRLSTPGHLRFTQAANMGLSFGGSEANVAISLAVFGINAGHVTAFPHHDLGDAAIMHLKKYGVDTTYITRSDDRMGVYFLENGAMQRSSRIIYDRFDSAFAKVNRSMFNWNEILRGVTWFHWSGITPAISQGAADVCLDAVTTAQEMGITVSGDINYRRNLWQYGKSVRDIMPGLIQQTNIVIGGSVDFENCTGVTADSFEEACLEMTRKFPSIRKIVNTKRTSVSSSHNRMKGMLFDGQRVIKSKRYNMTHIVDRVGTGDAFMAGLIYGMLKGFSDEQALAFAMAAGALKHSISEDVNLVTVEEVEALVKEENVGKLLR